MIQRLITGLLMLAVVACAQPRVDPRNLYHRIIVVVPFAGQGTQADPKRPQYSPAPQAAAVPQTASAPEATATPGPAVAPAAPAVIAYTHVLSDDGKYAIAEFVAKDMAAFQAILSDASLKVFVKGRDSKATIEAAMRKYRKDFSLDTFGVVIP